MKIVFNFNKRIGKRWLGGLALAACLLTARPARAEGVYFTARELLADFFRTSQNVSYKRLTLSDEQKQRLAHRLGYTPSRSSYIFYVASSAHNDKAEKPEKIDGYAFIDEENGEHLPITFAVKLSPDGVVQRQEVLAYREPRGDEVRDDHFRQQFVGKSARDAIAFNQDIVAISGATISSRAMAVGVRRAVVLFDELLRPGQVVSRR
jgi:hypothetical protein